MLKVIVSTAILGIGTLSLVSLLIISFNKRKVKKCSCNPRVKNKIIVITETGCEIGVEIALYLASYGARVYICCPSEDYGECVVSQIRRQLKTNQVFFIPLDFSSLKSAKECAAILSECESKIDILIHNASVFHAESELTEDGFEISCQTNFIGPVLFTETLLPLLFESTNPRVIFAGSEPISKSSNGNIHISHFKERSSLPNFDVCVKHFEVIEFALKLYAGFLAETDKSSPFVVSIVSTGIIRANHKKGYWWPWTVFQSLISWSEKDIESFKHAVNSEKIKNGSFIRDCSATFPFVSSEEISEGKKLMEEVFSSLHLK